MDFMLIAGGGDDDKVVATDQTGRTLLYHAESDSVRTLCNLTAPKLAPVSFTAGGNNNLYILDKVFHPRHSRYHCFDALVYGDGDGAAAARYHDWHCRPLPPPPYARTHDPGVDGDPFHFHSYPLVGDGGGGGASIWVSKDSVAGLGTHSFDVAASVWSKAGDWALPFYGRGHHVDELGLWLGLSCGYGEESAVVAADLAVAPPRAIGVRWWEFAPPGWIVGSSHLVHLGRSGFCHARFFETRRRGEGCRKFVVFAGIEVERRGGELYVLKHRSERYSIDYRLFQRVL